MTLILTIVLAILFYTGIWYILLRGLNIRPTIPFAFVCTCVCLFFFIIAFILTQAILHVLFGR